MGNAKPEETPSDTLDLLLSKSWKVNPVQHDEKSESVLEVQNGKTVLYLLVKQNKTKKGRVSYRIRLYNDKDKALKKLVA